MTGVDSWGGKPSILPPRPRSLGRKQWAQSPVPWGRWGLGVQMQLCGAEEGSDGLERKPPATQKGSKGVLKAH